MNNLQHRLFAGILACATLLRFWGTFDIQDQIGDEIGFVAFSKNLIANGVGDWKYAPMTDLSLAVTIRLFGDNPFGWRISAVLFGTAAVLLVYLIARRLYGDGYTPLLAASLLAFDPFHIHFSHTVTQEMPTIFFFLLFFWLALEYTEKQRPTLFLAGCALGLTIATKMYFVFAIPLVCGYIIYRRMSSTSADRIAVLIDLAAKLLLLPLAIYLLAHIFWFGRGHTFSELLLLKSDAYWIFSHKFTFTYAEILSEGGKPWEWFIKPFSFGHHLSQEEQYGRFALQINNPLFRLMVLPAMVFVISCAAKTRQLQHALPPLLFAACYTLFFLAGRPINSYSALALLPFAWLMLAQAVTMLARRRQRETEVSLAFLCAIVLWGVYLFPVAVGFRIPVSLYQPLLSLSTITRVF